MRRNLRILGVTTLVLFVGATLVVAGGYPIHTPSKPPSGERQLYDRNSLLKQDDSFASSSMPTVSRDGDGPMPSPGFASSPNMFSLSMDESMMVGGVLPDVRGGAMSTPRQRADREIRKLIRLLD